MNNVPRMRTIRQTAELLELPEYFVRQLVKENRIPYVLAGRKALINVDRMIDYLNGEGGENV
ncbi:MAG: DNA-binding protein [Ruminiclostridium sp.]|nr:DNA-binding protein [Ruminiclostridium sp.]